MTDPTPEMVALYDKNGRQIAIGDVLKVYHYTAALRRKRRYMYKQAMRVREWESGFRAVFFSHLDLTDGGYFEALDGRKLTDYEIVQSARADHEDRPIRAYDHIKPENG